MKYLYANVALFALALAFSGGEPPVSERKESCGDLYQTIPKGAIKIALPDVQQPEDFSCGAAATMAILAYYGVGPEDYDVLKRRLGTTKKNGTDYQRIIKYAKKLTKKYGIHAEAHKEMTLKQLDRYLDEGKPVICSIQAYDDEVKDPKKLRAIYKDTNENGHYAVAIGYDANNYYFMDSSLTGRRGYLPRDEFEERWHDNEGTEDKPNPIRHLGLVIWKEDGESAYARCARKID